MVASVGRCAPEVSLPPAHGCKCCCARCVVLQCVAWLMVDSHLRTAELRLAFFGRLKKKFFKIRSQVVLWLREEIVFCFILFFSAV